MEAPPSPDSSETLPLLSDEERATPEPMPTTPTTARKSLEDAVMAIHRLKERAGMAALCSALTVNMRADCVNLALADALASVSLDIGMAMQAAMVAAQKNTYLAKNHYVGRYIDGYMAFFGAQAASSVSAGYPDSGSDSSLFFSFRRRLSSSTPSSFWAVWLWWPLAWFYHLLLGPVDGQSHFARYIPHCSLHALWTAALEAVDTAAAAAEMAVHVHENHPASTTTKSEIEMWRKETPLTQTQTGVDANDIFCLHTASELALAAASAGRSLATSALGASNPAQARRVMAAVRRATRAALCAKWATVSLAHFVMAADPDHPDLGPEDKNQYGFPVYTDNRDSIKQLDLWGKAMADFASPSTSPKDVSDFTQRKSLFTTLVVFDALCSSAGTVDYIPTTTKAMLDLGSLVVTSAQDEA